MRWIDRVVAAQYAEQTEVKPLTRGEAAGVASFVLGVIFTGAAIVTHASSDVEPDLDKPNREAIVHIEAQP